MQRRRTTILALVAAALTIGVLWYANRPVIPKEATWEDVQAEARVGGYRLINTDELAERYRQDPQKLLLVDTRQEWEYRTGHIQDAVNFSIEPTAWSRWRSQGQLSQFLGPDKNRLIVFYWAGLTWVRSDSAARVAVKLGYKNVYRDPLGFPEWQKHDLPVVSAPMGLSETAGETKAPGPLSGWAMV